MPVVGPGAGPPSNDPSRVRRIRFDSQSVVYGDSKLLLASEVALRRLDGDEAERELDLIQFVPCEVAETRERPSIGE